MAIVTKNNNSVKYQNLSFVPVTLCEVKALNLRNFAASEVEVLSLCAITLCEFVVLNPCTCRTV